MCCMERISRGAARLYEERYTNQQTPQQSHVFSYISTTLRNWIIWSNMHDRKSRRSTCTVPVEESIQQPVLYQIQAPPYWSVIKVWLVYGSQLCGKYRERNIWIIFICKKFRYFKKNIILSVWNFSMFPSENYIGSRFSNMRFFHRRSFFHSWRCFYNTHNSHLWAFVNPYGTRSRCA